ncbi:MAG: hypothetical protein ACYTGB_08310 [Planctomycetota bacterium]|jgi:hypothetical protein
MRRVRSWILVLGCVLVAAGLAAVLSSGGEAPAPAPAGRGAREHIPCNPLFYAEIRDLKNLETRLAGLKIWARKDEATKKVKRLVDLGARQVAAMVNKEDSESGREILRCIGSLHVAVYPPPSFPPELLVVAELTDPAALRKAVDGEGVKKKLGTHRGVDLYSLRLSLNGIKDTSVAAISGKLLLLSPYELRVRQALDVAAAGEGALPVSPGFADCAKRFSTRPVWGYLNIQGMCCAGGLDDMMVEEMQAGLVALGLPSYRWAGFGSTVGAGEIPFECHLEYYKWSPLAGFAPGAKAPDPSLAECAPANVLFYAQGAVGDPVKAWNAIRAKILRAAPAFAFDEGAEAGEEFLKELKTATSELLGCDVRKEILPLMSGDLACFLAGGDALIFCVVVGTPGEEKAKQLMAKLKVKDGTVAVIGGDEDAGGDVPAYAGRAGRNVLIGDNPDVIKAALAARAAKKTLGNSAAFKAKTAALGKGRGLTVFVPAGKAPKEMAEEMPMLGLLAKEYTSATRVTLSKTGVTCRSTGAVEALWLLPMLTELDGLAAELEAKEHQRRLGAIAEAAGAFAARSGGRWPKSSDQLGPAFKAGSLLRRVPGTRTEYRFADLGLVPPKASRQVLLLCYPPDALPGAQVLMISGGRAHVSHLGRQGLKSRLTRDGAILAVADPTRVKLSDEEKKAAADASGKLGATEFPVRDAATKKMQELGVKAVPTLVALLDSRDPEVASRAEGLLKKLTGLKDKAAVKRLAP